MLNIKIENTGDFIRKLVNTDMFDSFLLVDAVIRSGSTYHINGGLNKEFYDDDELKLLPSTIYSAFSANRHLIYDMIKGKNKPLGFKIILILSDQAVTKIIEQNNLAITSDDVANFSLNIIFDGNKLNLTALASLKTFSTDKSTEELWDSYIKLFLKKHEIN